MGELSMPMVFGFAVVLTAGIIGEWLLFRKAGRWPQSSTGSRPEAGAVLRQGLLYALFLFFFDRFARVILGLGAFHLQRKVKSVIPGPPGKQKIEQTARCGVDRVLPESSPQRAVCSLIRAAGPRCAGPVFGLLQASSLRCPEGLRASGPDRLLQEGLLGLCQLQIRRRERQAQLLRRAGTDDGADGEGACKEVAEPHRLR